MAFIPGGGTTGDTAKKKPKSTSPVRTEGGYIIGQDRFTGPSPTGLWRDSPRGNVPVTQQQRKQAVKSGYQQSQFTYQNYDVPYFPDSPLVGMPADMGYGVEGQFVRGTNTQADLEQLFNSRNTNKIRTLQTQMFKAGWLGKQSITGKATSEGFRNALAFLFYQGNMLGEAWTTIRDLGPQGLQDNGGLSVKTSQGPNGPGGPGYGVPTKSVSESVDYATKGEARSLLRTALADVLGRGPKSGELDEFLDLLREKQKENPTVSTQTSIVNSETDSSSSSETDGGYTADDAAGLAERFATQQNPNQAQRYKKAGYEQLLDSLIAGG